MRDRRYRHNDGKKTAGKRPREYARLLIDTSSQVQKNREGRCLTARDTSQFASAKSLRYCSCFDTSSLNATISLLFLMTARTVSSFKRFTFSICSRYLSSWQKRSVSA